MDDRRLGGGHPGRAPGRAGAQRSCRAAGLVHHSPSTRCWLPWLPCCGTGFPPPQRGLVSGILAVCLPVASVSGTFLVQLFSGHQVTMFLVPCAVGGFFILLFAATLNDRRLATEDKPGWSLRGFASTFYVRPARQPGLRLGLRQSLHAADGLRVPRHLRATTCWSSSAAPRTRCPRQLFLGTLVQSAAVLVIAPLSGRLSDWTGRRKVFVLTASVVYGLALFVIALASSFDGFLVGMAIGGLGFGMYMAVDLALVADVLPDQADAAKDLGVFNIAGALPFSLAPAIAPAILVVGGGELRGAVCGRRGLCPRRCRRHPARQAGAMKPTRGRGSRGGRGRGAGAA